jgi:2-polyprenyl-3-methyl-5-hydroxy-6-metoxy-1,4-benzoquinol methylase
LLDPALDPVAAYDRIAGSFARLSEARRPYLEAVERLIVSAVPPGASSLLDIGAGDGRRAIRIAQTAGLKHVVLLDPSAEMRRNWPAGVTAWPMRAEDLHAQTGQYDIITCLWNVLGHIFPANARSEVLRQCARLLAPGGRILVDVSHRYNARHYGVWPTAWRCLRGGSGDVTVTWRPEGIATAGHVFTHREFAGLCRASGVAIERRFVLDYATGALRRWSWQGHLLYVLRHGSDFSGGNAGEKRQG